jgi:hypothetical protein
MVRKVSDPWNVLGSNSNRAGGRALTSAGTGLFSRIPNGHGGRRRGAGRPRSKRGKDSHGKRPALNCRFPVHITMCCHGHLPILRDPCTYQTLVSVIRTMLGRGCFRVVLYSIQDHHVPLICEAENEKCLSEGMRSLAIRMARAFNRLCCRRGSLWAKRYHSRILRTPVEVRRVIAYVLGNRRHHGGQHEPRQTIDPCSSARWFSGFIESLPPLPAGFIPPTSQPCTWLLSVGWRRHGLISVDEGPWVK